MEKTRTTKNKKAVLNFLEKCSKPVSIDEIFIYLKKDFSNISISTIYRIMEKFEKSEIVRRISSQNDKKALFELIKPHHFHYLICNECKKMIPVDLCPIEKLSENIANKTGFTITGHRFEIYGLCKNCSKRNIEN